MIIFCILVDYPILSLPKDQWVHYAINKYARYFHGAKVAVFGSMEPWAEAAALYAGAKEVSLFFKI